MSLLNVWVYYVLLPYWSITALLFALHYYLPTGKLSQYAGFFARSSCFLAGLITCAIYGSLVSVLLNFIGKAGLSQWMAGQSFKWVMWPLVGIWFDIDDESRKRLRETRPAVFLGNHQTELDILFLAHVWPKYTSVTAKSDLKYYPFLGQFMWLSNTVFINRSSHKSAIAAFDSASKHMRDERQSVFIFPEGTRSYSQKPELLPFKKGAFHLAVQAQVPIVPVVCANYAKLVSIQKKRFIPGRIPVRVLKPIPTTGLTGEDVEDLMRYVREEMMEALKDLEVTTPAEYAHTNGSATAPELKKKAEIAMAS